MRSYFSILLLFILASAHAQYRVDWSKAPLNPVPEQYTRNHFKITGDVESFKDIYAGTIIKFDKQGRALARTSERDTTLWEYDSGGNLVRQLLGENREVMASYKTNDKGLVIAIIPEGGEIQTITYNDRGLFESKMEGDVPVVKYAYDDKGRVIQEEFFYNGVPNMLAVYEYSNSKGGLIVKTTHINRNINEMQKYTQEFNEKGDMIVRNDKQRKYQYDKKGNILSSTGTDFPVKYSYVYFSDLKRREKK